MNESLDRLHPETTDYPAQYLLVNEDYGTVIWCESHHTAVRACKASPNGGIIINTATADPALVARVLANARHNMDAKPNTQPDTQDSRSRLDHNTPADAKDNPTA